MEASKTTLRDALQPLLKAEYDKKEELVIKHAHIHTPENLVAGSMYSPAPHADATEDVTYFTAGNFVEQTGTGATGVVKESANELLTDTNGTITGTSGVVLNIGTATILDLDTGTWDTTGDIIEKNLAKTETITVLSSGKIFSLVNTQLTNDSQSTNTATAISSAVIDHLHDVNLITTGGSDSTVTLPSAAANAGRVIKFIKADTGTGKLIIVRAGSDTLGINANTTMELWYQDNYVDLMSDGSSRWVVVNTEVFMVPMAKRGDDYIDDGTTNGDLGGATTTGAWTSVSLANYVPVGTQFSYFIQIIMSETSTGAVTLQLRPHGSTDTDFQQTFVNWFEDEDANVHDGGSASHGFTEVGYNSGVPTIEYYLNGSGAKYYQAQRGYRLG